MSYYLYASQMWRAMNCPGSVKATRREKSSGGSGSPEATFGRELHKMTEEVIDGKLNIERISEPERDYILRCIEFLKGKELKGETETPLFLLVAGELIASSRADLLSVGDEGEVVIPDWKFYRAPLDSDEWEWQGKTMCAAALQEHKNCHVAVAVAYLPILDMTYDCRLDRGLLTETVIEIFNTWQAANKEDPELNAGSWCARCEALTSCPAAAASITDLALQANFEAIRTPGSLPTVKVMERHFLSELNKWSRGRFAGYVELLPFLQPLVDALKKALHEDIEKGHLHTNWKLVDRRNNRKATVSELRKVLGDLYQVGFTSEEIDAMCTPRIGDVAKALAKKGYTEVQIDTMLETFDQGSRDQLTRVH